MHVPQDDVTGNLEIFLELNKALAEKNGQLASSKI